MLELSHDVLEAAGADIPFGDDHHVERPAEQLRMQPERLADHPLHPISDDGPTDLAAHRDTDTGVRCLGALQQIDEARRETPDAATADGLVFRALSDAVCLRKTEKLPRSGAGYFLGVEIATW
jgi:hypothetical protein